MSEALEYLASVGETVEQPKYGLSPLLPYWREWIRAQRAKQAELERLHRKQSK